MFKIKKLLKIIFRNKIIFLLSLIKNIVESYVYDIKRYLKYSTTIKNAKTFKQLESKIYAHCHVIEKGLSLKETRLGYGKDVVNSLFELIKKYKLYEYPEDNIVFKTAVSVMNSYIDFHEKKGYSLEKLKKQIKDISNYKGNEYGGIKTFKKEQILKYGKSNFYNMAKNRFSIRNFSSEPVKLEKIIEAIKIAQKSPSVCNRQSTHVYIIQDQKIRNQLLVLQNGNRGFSHLIDKILIITSDLQSFDGIKERNQAFIDSGIFTMSLLYALQYEGIGACTLNWCSDIGTDKKLQKIIKINNSENVILMIAVGNLPELIKVTKSSKKNLNDIIYLR